MKETAAIVIFLIAALVIIGMVVIFLPILYLFYSLL